MISKNVNKIRIQNKKNSMKKYLQSMNSYCIVHPGLFYGRFNMNSDHVRIITWCLSRKPRISHFGFLLLTLYLKTVSPHIELLK